MNIYKHKQIKKGVMPEKQQRSTWKKRKKKL